MNRVKNFRSRLSAKKLALPVLIIGIILGVALIGYGAIKIHGYHEELGTKNTDEINTEIGEKAEEYASLVNETTEEFEKNGITDKYLELNDKSNKLSKEITALTNSRYMKETGYHNPNSISKILTLAPTIWIGALVVIASVIVFVAMKEQGKEKKEKEEK